MPTDSRTQSPRFTAPADLKTKKTEKPDMRRREELLRIIVYGLRTRITGSAK